MSYRTAPESDQHLEANFLRGEQHELLVPPLVADGDFYLPSLNSRSTTTRSTVPLDDLDRREIDDQQLLPEIDESPDEPEREGAILRVPVSDAYSGTTSEFAER